MFNLDFIEYQLKELINSKKNGFKIKSEVTSIKNIGKQASKFEEEGKEKPMTWNCKKSKCLKFYWDCLADGRMCTSECNCWDCANNDHHIGKLYWPYCIV